MGHTEPMTKSEVSYSYSLIWSLPITVYGIDIIHQLIRNIVMGVIWEQNIQRKDSAILFTKVMLIGCLSAQRICI